MLTLLIISWVVSGIIGATIYHTSEFDMEPADLPVVIFVGCTLGYFIFVMGLATLYKGVLIKKRK